MNSRQYFVFRELDGMLCTKTTMKSLYNYENIEKPKTNFLTGLTDVVMSSHVLWIRLMFVNVNNKLLTQSFSVSNCSKTVDAWADNDHNDRDTRRHSTKKWSCVWHASSHLIASQQSLSPTCEWSITFWFAGNWWVHLMSIWSQQRSSRVWRGIMIDLPWDRRLMCEHCPVSLLLWDYLMQVACAARLCGV